MKEFVMKEVYVAQKYRWFGFLGAVAAIFMIAGVVHSQEHSIDFEQVDCFGTSPTTVQFNNILVDVTIPNIFSNSVPRVITADFNVLFQFDPETLHLIPVDVINPDMLPSHCADMSVVVHNAFNGEQISGASVSIGNTTHMTNAEGIASFHRVSPGFTQITAGAMNFTNSQRAVILECGSNDTIGISLNPSEGNGGSMRGNEVRVVLSWGENPQDLDAHLTGPSNRGESRFHVYWWNASGSDVAVLDIDDTTSYGPETMTISPPSGSGVLRPGLYRYSVHHYKGTGTISDNAKVELYIGDHPARIFTPPAYAPGDDTVWTVFELNVDENGEISMITVNAYTPHVRPSRVRSRQPVK
jgi:hypothetical protein